jgi:type II secretion system protein N
MSGTTETLDTNLLQSAKKPKESSPDPVASRKKRVLKIVSYIGFFLCSLVFFTVIKIPDAAIANFLLASAHKASPAYQFQAEKIGVRFFPLPHLEAEKFAMEPRFPGSAIPLLFDELRVYPNPLILGASFSADAYKAKIHGSGSMGSFRIESDNIDLAKVTPLTEMGLDLKGLVNLLYVKLATSNQRLSTANGEIRLKVKNFVFDPSTFASQVGMSIPPLSLGDVDIEGEATNGTFRFTKAKIGGPTKDVEIQIPSGIITLSDVTLNTKYDITLHVKPSAESENKIPAFAMVGAMGHKRPDGFISIKVAGNLVGPPQITKGN